MALDVHVTESSLGGGNYLYQVWADGKVYEQLFLYPGASPLTFSQQIDMGRLYEKALNEYN